MASKFWPTWGEKLCDVFGLIDPSTCPTMLKLKNVSK